MRSGALVVSLSVAASTLAADHPASGQLRWITYTGGMPHPSGTPRTDRTGWYDGAAGIARFLLDLHGALTGGR